MPVESPHLLLATGQKIYLLADDGLQYTRTIGMGPNYNTVSTTKSLVGNNALTVGDVCHLILVDPTTGDTIRLQNETIHEVENGNDTRGGEVVKITLKDPRHILNQGSVTGYYNLPHAAPKLVTVKLDLAGNPELPLKPIRPKDQIEVEQRTLDKLTFPATLRTLVEMCFAALNLSTNDYDTSMLKIRTSSDIPIPNPDQLQIGDDLPLYPAVQWEYENPAREIERLLNEHGMAVVLWTNGVNGDANSAVGQSTGGDLSNKMVVVRLGAWHPQQRTGFTPPSGTWWQETSDKRTSTGLAEETIVVGGRTVVEEVTDLVPVGLDLDGEIRPLADLSYATDVSAQLPYGRFERVSKDDSFIDIAVEAQNGNVQVPVAGAGADFKLEDVIKVASASVWKWYRLPKNQLWKLPMLNKLVSTTSVTGQPVRKDPYVDLAEWRAEISSGKLGENVTIEDLSDRYDVDLELGLVRFHAITVQFATDSAGTGLKLVPAKVSLHWARNAAHLFAPLAGGVPDPNPEKWRSEVKEDNFYFYPPDASLDRANALRHPELQLFQSAPENAINGPYTDLNRNELDDYALKLILRARYTSQPYLDAPSGSLPGLVKFSTDGYMRQITWSIQNNASTTILAGNRERQRGVLAPIEPYESRLFKRKTVKAVVAANTGVLALPDFSVLPNGRGAAPRMRAPENAVQAATRPGTVGVMNVSTKYIPAFSFVQVVGNDRRLGLLRVVAPTSNGVDRGLFVTQSPLAPKSTGYAAHSGLTLIRLMAGGSYSISDFIGPDFDHAIPTDVAQHTGPLVGKTGGVYPILAYYDATSMLSADTPFGLIQLASAPSNDTIRVVITAYVEPGRYYIAKRLMPDPASSGQYGWIKDTTDTADYFVRPFPGGGSIYPGMRLGVEFSHVASLQSIGQKRIHIPRYGDCFGFQASIFGAPIGASPGTSTRYYQWSQIATGLFGNELLGSGQTREGFNYPPALLLNSVGSELAGKDLPFIHGWITPGYTDLHPEGFIFSGPYHYFTTTICQTP